MEIPLARNRDTGRLTGLVIALLTVAGSPVGCSGRTPPAAEIGLTSVREVHGLLSVDTPDGHAVLHAPSRAATNDEPELRTLVAAMETVARAHDAGGLAAVQLGVPLRVILLRREADDHSSRFQSLIDPTVLARSRRRIGSWERCLSVPWGYRYTERPAALVVRYRDLAGGWHRERVTGGEAAVLQHELDHLDGRLLSDGLGRDRFIPGDRIADIAKAARQRCADAAPGDCREAMRAQWQAWSPTAPRPLEGSSEQP